MKISPHRLVVSALIASASLLSVFSSAAQAYWTGPVYEVSRLKDGATDPHTTDHTTPSGGGLTSYFSSTTTGIVSAKFTWEHDVPNDSPPADVYVLEYGHAEWIGGYYTYLGRQSQKSRPSFELTSFSSKRRPRVQLVQTLGNFANDGLGHPEVVSYPNNLLRGISEGYKVIKLQPNANGEITTPNVTLTAHGDYPAMPLWNFSAQIITAEIHRDTEDITDPKTSPLKDVNVGEPIGLSAVISGVPGDVPVTGKTWTVEGTAVKSYTISNHEGKKTDLSAADLTDKYSVDFYWFEGKVDANGAPAAGGTKVKFDVNIAGTTIQLTSTFTVNRPTSSLTGTYTDRVPPVGVSYFLIGTDERIRSGLGDMVNTGITFTGQVSTPAHGAGTLGYIQIMTEDTTQTRNNGVPRSMNSNGKLVLDDGDSGTTIFYPRPYTTPQKSIDDSDTQAMNTEDTPEDHLLPAYKKVSTTNSFEMYLMYKAADKYTNNPNIWVPLRMVSWGWSATAEKIAATYPTGTQKWEEVGQGTPSRAATDPSLAALTGSSTTTPPKWEKSHSELQWVG